MRYNLLDHTVKHQDFFMPSGHSTDAIHAQPGMHDADGNQHRNGSGFVPGTTSAGPGIPHQSSFRRYTLGVQRAVEFSAHGHGVTPAFITLSFYWLTKDPRTSLICYLDIFGIILTGS